MQVINYYSKKSYPLSRVVFHLYGFKNFIVFIFKKILNNANN